MEKEIEQSIMKILNQVSFQEQRRNRFLPGKTMRVLKSLAYMKAMMDNKKLGAS